MKTEIWKEMPETTLSSTVPDNYERFFVPVIGKPVAEDLIRKAAIQPGEKVLDVACGTGIVARLAKEKVGASGTVTGLDINAGMLEVARSIDLQRPQIEWIEASAEKLPLSDEMYNVVTCQMGLQFIEDKMAALREIRRVLVPKGRIILNLPGPSELLVALDKAIEQHINSQAAGFVGMVYSLYDSDEIEQLMARAGFYDITIEKKQKSLNLPAPKDFLWQYVYGTPLAGLFAEANEDVKYAFEKTVVNKWKDISDNGRIIYNQPIVEIEAYK
jgi:ubiquinone/menaquinone biosynthesis C-methylase UbiE